MNPGDTVYCQHIPKKGKPPIWCRCIIKERHGPTARLSCWTGKEFVAKNEQIKNLKTEKP